MTTKKKGAPVKPPKRAGQLRPAERKGSWGVKATDVAPYAVEREEPSRERLRFEAGLIYTTDPDGVTVGDLRQDPRFAAIPEEAIYTWSKTDRWTERRRLVFERIRQKAEQQIGSVLVKARLAEVEELAAVKEIAMGWIKSGIAPKSLEGLIKSLIELNVRREELALGIMTEAMPGLHVEGGSSTPAIGQSEFSVAEARDLAHRAIASRREAIRIEVRKEAKPEEPGWVCGSCGLQSAVEAEFQEHKCGEARPKKVAVDDDAEAALDA